MNRLTPFAKLLFLLLIGVALFFGIKTFFGDQLGLNGNDTPTEQVEQNDNTSEPSESTNSNKVISKNKSKTKSASFDYKPQAPIGGKLMGVVELGASGFNSFIIRKDGDDNWEKVKYEWGNSMVADGMASNADVTTGLKRYISNILDFGVKGKDIHFVVSSGAKKEPAVLPIIKGLKDMGYFVNEVTAEQEGEYALRSVLPSSFNNRAFVVDIGSGNTKVSWIKNGRITAKEGPGAKYYNKNISDAQAYNDVKNIGKTVPTNLAKTCFIIGGIPFNMAKESRNGEERYTVLSAPNAYTKLAEKKGKKVESGLNLYQGIIDGSGCDTFIFDWNANFTIGFLLALPG